jgi:predicted type IV restriction endonuclease
MFVLFLMEQWKSRCEEDLTGDFVKAHGQFDFMIRRGPKVICIVEAKKYDMEQGMAQDLVGCEVAVEVGELDIVYGIVTNF